MGKRIEKDDVEASVSKILNKKKEKNKMSTTPLDRQMLKIYARSFYDFQQIKNEFGARFSQAGKYSEEVKNMSKERRAELDQFKKQLEIAEKNSLKILVPYLEAFPVYTEYLSNIKGCAERMSACLISSIVDITRFSTVSKLWAYSGLHVIDGRAVKRVKGKTSNWNSFLKSKLYVLSDCLIKQNFDSDRNPLKYRKIYDDYKHRVESRPKCHLTKEEHAKSKDAKVTWLPNGCTKGHVHNMSLRYMQKMFLQDLWVEWYKLEGIEPPRKSYAEEKLQLVHSG